MCSGLSIQSGIQLGLRRSRLSADRQAHATSCEGCAHYVSTNYNRLLGPYLPRRTDLSVYDQGDLDLIALKLNTRPRETLGYDTPAATLAKTVALTG